MNQILPLGLAASISIARQLPFFAAVRYSLGSSDAAIRRTMFPRKRRVRRLRASSSLAQFPETTGFAVRRGRLIPRTSRHKKSGPRTQMRGEDR